LEGKRRRKRENSKVTRRRSRKWGRVLYSLQEVFKKEINVR